MLEAAGIPTVMVAVAAFEQPLRKMALPRVLLTPFLKGRPLGPVGDAATQRDVLQKALDLLGAAEQPTMTTYQKA